MDFLESALPLKTDCFAELNQFNSGPYNIKKEESNYYTIKIFKNNLEKVTFNNSVSLI